MFKSGSRIGNNCTILIELAYSVYYIMFIDISINSRTFLVISFIQTAVVYFPFQKGYNSRCDSLTENSIRYQFVSVHNTTKFYSILLTGISVTLLFPSILLTPRGTLNRHKKWRIFIFSKSKQIVNIQSRILRGISRR